jgi:mRNA interferase RelE/StbE
VYEVVLSTSARKELRALADPLLSRVLNAMRALAGDPRPHGCRKLSGARDRWRIRVGDYRIVYEIEDEAKVVTIILVRHRSAAYE